MISKFAFIILGILAGVTISFLWFSKEGPSLACEKNYEFISPELSCEEDASIGSQRGYADLEFALANLIESQKKEEKILGAAVHIRNLRDGPILSMNIEEMFYPASLLKLPLYIAYIRLAKEIDPDILQRKITIEKFGEDVQQEYIQGELIQEGLPYTIDILLRKMIVNSDNRAYSVLSRYLTERFPSRNFYLETLEELGIVPRQAGSDVKINIRAYASLFRQLYFSVYLSRDMSEQVLEVLSSANFDKGLRAGLPKDMVVAQKFGERSDAITGEKQLHDCGIVYYPHNPYIICVMTKGKNIHDLAEFVSKVSKIVYQEFKLRETLL